MPDLGITRALRRAVRKGAKEAKVLRPGEVPETAPPATKSGPEAAPQAAPPAAAAPTLDPTPGPGPTPESVQAPAPKPAAPAAEPEIPREFLTPEEVTDVEAFRLRRAKLEDFKLDETYQPNFDTMTTTDDVKATIADVAQRNAGKIDEARRGTITNEQLSALADDLDVGEDVVKTILEREAGSTINAETILAARQVLNSSAERLKSLADKVSAGQATDMERIQFRRQFEFHREYQTQFMGARAEAGRALNAFRVPTGSGPAQIGRLNELLNVAYTDTDALARAVVQISDPQALNKFVRSYQKHKIAGVLKENFINSILFGPTSHLVNAMGSVLMQGVNIAETAVAARIGRFFNAQERVQVGEASALLQGTLDATRDAFRLAGRALREGRTLDDVVKYETGAPPAGAISAQNLLPEQWRSTPLGRSVDILGTVIRVPTERVMAPTDEFFKTLAYRAELQRRALLHVQDQLDSGALQLEDAARAVRDFMEDAPLTAQEAAMDYARYTAFQNPLGEVGQKFQTALTSVPALGLVAPFIRTPVNLFKAGILDRSPVALFTRKFYSEVAQGGRTRDMALARVTLGSLTSAYVASQVIDGNISGAGPKDIEARHTLELTGWRPYSIKDPVTGRWHSYARMEPIASVVGATADAVEIMSYLQDDVDSMKDENQQAADAAAAIIAGIANNTMNKTFMKGIADFTEMMSDPGRYVQNYGGEMIAANVPASALRRWITKTQDPYMREAWTIIEKLQAGSGIPGWSEDAPPRRDIFGNPKKYVGGSLLGTMSPIPDSRIKNDPVAQSLVSLMKQTREVPVTMPSKSVEGMRLNTKEYDDLVRFSRSEPVFGALTFREKIEEVMDTTTYQLATPFMQVEILKGVQTAADTAGRIQLELNNTQFAERIALYRAKQERLLQGE